MLYINTDFFTPKPSTSRLRHHLWGVWAYCGGSATGHTACLSLSGRRVQDVQVILRKNKKILAVDSLTHKSPKGCIFKCQPDTTARTRLKFGERCFAFAGPAAWNSRPSSVQELTDTTAFKCQLKTVLFQRCYSSST